MHLPPNRGSAANALLRSQLAGPARAERRPIGCIQCVGPGTCATAKGCILHARLLLRSLLTEHHFRSRSHGITSVYFAMIAAHTSP